MPAHEYSLEVGPGFLCPACKERFSSQNYSRQRRWRRRSSVFCCIAHSRVIHGNHREPLGCGRKRSWNGQDAVPNISHYARQLLSSRGGCII
mgnify:CR=1 FL=1